MLIPSEIDRKLSVSGLHARKGGTSPSPTGAHHQSQGFLEEMGREKPRHLGHKPGDDDLDGLDDEAEGEWEDRGSNDSGDSGDATKTVHPVDDVRDGYPVPDSASGLHGARPVSELCPEPFRRPLLTAGHAAPSPGHDVPRMAGGPRFSRPDADAAVSRP